MVLQQGRRSDVAAALFGAGLRLETLMPTQRLEDAFLDLLAAGDADAPVAVCHDRPDPHRVHQGRGRTRSLVIALLLSGSPR